MRNAEEERRLLEEARVRAEEARRLAEESAHMEKEERERKVEFDEINILWHWDCKVVILEHSFFFSVTAYLYVVRSVWRA